MDTSRTILYRWIGGAAAGVIVIGIAGYAIMASLRRAAAPAAPQQEAVPGGPASVLRDATVWLEAAAGSTLRVGEEGRLEVRVDTQGQGFTVMRTKIAYDAGALEVVGVDGTGSAFPMDAVPPGALASSTVETVRFITRDPLQPAYRGFSGAGLFATLRVKPRHAGAVTVRFIPEETEYVPFGAARESRFTQVTDGEFIVE